MDTPTSELDAINNIIGSIGMAPINSLEGAVTADIALARRLLTTVRREVCSTGWHFNTESEWSMTRNMSGEIILPVSILRCDLDRNQWAYKDVVIRGRKLYDKKTHSYTFLTNVTATVVLLLSFDELPDAARDYVTLRAARRFQTQTVGSPTLDGFTEADEFRALVTLKEQDGDDADYSFLTPTEASSLYRG